MAYQLDTSPLFAQPAPSAHSRFLGGAMDIVGALMQRRQRQQELEAEQAAKAEELKFRQGQEQRLTKRQEMLDQRDSQREDRRDQRAGMVAVAGAKPEDRAFVGQAYGGQLAPMQPDYGGEQFLENVQDDESSPLGFSYNVNPEHERRTQEAAGKQTLTMPGGQQMTLGGQDAASHFAKLRQVYASMPEGPEKAMRMRSLQESEAAALGGEETLNYTRQNAAMFGQDQRAEAALAARARRGGGGGPAGAAKDKNDDLDVLDETGSVIGSGRTVPEATALRKKRDALDTAKKAAEELKAHLDQYGNINLLDIFTGDYGQGGNRAGFIDRLVTARKEVTGALNEGDIGRYQKQFDISKGRTPEQAKAAVDSFVRELQNSYGAQVKSTMSRPKAAGGGPAQYGPVTTRTTKKGEQVRVRQNLSTGQWEEVD